MQTKVIKMRVAGRELVFCVGPDSLTPYLVEMFLPPGEATTDPEDLLLALCQNRGELDALLTGQPGLTTKLADKLAGAVGLKRETKVFTHENRITVVVGGVAPGWPFDVTREAYRKFRREARGGDLFSAASNFALAAAVSRDEWQSARDADPVLEALVLLRMVGHLAGSPDQPISVVVEEAETKKKPLPSGTH